MLESDGASFVAPKVEYTPKRMSENSRYGVETGKPKYYNLSSINQEKTEVQGHDIILSY